jgi:hypothetical protein
MTSEKLHTAMLRTTNTKFGDIVPSMPGILIFMVEDIVARPRKIANERRLAGDHDPAATNTTAAPEHKTNHMYALAFRGISFAPLTLACVRSPT